MSKASLTLPPLTGIADRNTQSALQAIANWARAINSDYVSRDELKLTRQQVITEAAQVVVGNDGEGLTLPKLMTYLQSSAASILAASANLIQTDPDASVGVKIGSAGIVGYDPTGNATFTLDARTGDATFYGTVTGGSIVGTTNVSSAGYIYATGVNLEKAIEFRPGLTYYGVIVGESEDPAESFRAGSVGITRGTDSVAVAGYASGARSFGGAFIGTDAGIYAGGINGGTAANLDGNVRIGGSLNAESQINAAASIVQTGGNMVLKTGVSFYLAGYGMAESFSNIWQRLNALDGQGIPGPHRPDLA